MTFVASGWGGFWTGLFIIKALDLSWSLYFRSGYEGAEGYVSTKPLIHESIIFFLFYIEWAHMRDEEEAGISGLRALAPS